MAPGLSASRQVTFHQFLVGARKKWLVDALREAVGRVDPRELRNQLAEYVPEDVQRLLATAGIRDEEVFPTPVLLEAQPTLVGYYRLLLGMSQKTFYATDTGMSLFKSMEESGKLDKTLDLAGFCGPMSAYLADLVRQLSPTASPRDIGELTILTLGAQLQGRNNNTIGQAAIDDVFLAVADIVKSHTTERTRRKLVVTNASARKVIIVVASDPDIRIQEEVNGVLRNRIAIEVKGGTDISNVHNRAGEAEKSHNKARLEGFREFWTIILMKNVPIAKLHNDSATTTAWFDAPQILGRQGEDWNEFRSGIIGAVGIPGE